MHHPPPRASEATRAEWRRRELEAWAVLGIDLARIKPSNYDDGPRFQVVVRCPPGVAMRPSMWRRFALLVERLVACVRPDGE